MKTLSSVRSRIQTITLWRGQGSLQDALCPLARMLAGRLAVLLFLSYAAVLAQPCAATPLQWEDTGSLNVGREYHTATLFSDGRVLVAGGGTNGPEIYPNPYTTSAELYDPVTGNWTVTGSLNYPRSLHTATLLPSGKVLVAGGSHFPASAELYDPATGTWSVTGTLITPRYGYHTATLLPDGRVLVAGGRYNVASAELYNPATGTWTATGSLHTGRSDHTATLLLNGKVLVAGGMNQSFTFGALTSTELYDPATGTWTVTGDHNVPRLNHTATLLPDGRV